MTKTANKLAIKTLPALRASLLWYKSETVRTLRRRAEDMSTPKMRAAIAAKASSVSKMDLADLRHSYQCDRVQDITSAPLFALGTAIPSLVRMTVAVTAVSATRS